jgi:hypothetical protein
MQSGNANNYIATFGKKLTPSRTANYEITGHLASKFMVIVMIMLSNNECGYTGRKGNMAMVWHNFCIIIMKIG